MNNKGIKFLTVAAVLAMALAAFVVVNDSGEGDALTTIDLTDDTGVTVYASESDFNTKTGGETKSLLAALTAQADGQFWQFKAGIYNVTYRAVPAETATPGVFDYDTYSTAAGSVNAGSAMVIKNTITLVGTVDNGEPATTLYTDYAALGYADRATIKGGYMNNYFSANELIYAKGTGKDLTIKNMELMPLVYYSNKYSGENLGIPKGEETRWYTPNVTISSWASNVYLDNVHIVKNSLGVKDPSKDVPAYMLDDAGNSQQMVAGTWTLTDVTTDGGFGLDKADMTISMTDVTMNFGGDEVGDQRTIKFKRAGSTWNTADNVVINIDEVTGHGKSSPLSELKGKLLSTSAPALPSGVTINLNADVSLDADVTIPAGVVLNVYGTLAAGTHITNNGTINVYGELTGDVDGTIMTMVTVPDIKEGTVTPEGGALAAFGKTITLADATPIANTDLTVVASEGYKFIGWTQTKTSTGAADVSATVPMYGITLTPSIVELCNVTFMNSELVYDTEVVDSGDVVAEPEKPTKEGYTFTGWFKDSKCTVKYDFSAPVTSSFTLYAGWSENAKIWTVVFMNGELEYTSQLVENGKMATKPTDPVKDGYRFSAWLDKNDEKFDFASKITADTVLHADWVQLCYVSVPATVDGIYSTTNSGSHYVDFSEPGFYYEFDVVATGEYVVMVFNNNHDIEPYAGNTYRITDFSENVSITVGALKAGEAKTVTESVTENLDGTVTKSTVAATENVATGATVIEERASTDGAADVMTTANVNEASASVVVGSTGNTAVISETVSNLIKAAAENAGAVADSVSIAIETEATTVTMPKELLHDENVKDVTVTFSGATVVFPKAAVAEYEMADTISLSVTDAGQAPAAAIPEGASATGAFDLTLGGSNTTQFVGTVKITVQKEIPAGARDVKFLCVGGEGAGQSYDATVAGGNVTGELPHFSTWTIIFTLPADADIIDGDELPPTWNYVPQQQSSSSNTTMIVAACAAACAVIAVMLVVINVMRKS